MNGYKNCQDNLKIEYIENIETLSSFVFRAPSLVSVLSILNVAHHKLLPGMLILVLVLKDSLRTFFKSLSLSWSLGVRSLSLSLSLGVRVQEVLVLVLVLGGQVLVLILVFSPYKDLFPLFHYSDLFA